LAVVKDKKHKRKAMGWITVIERRKTMHEPWEKKRWFRGRPKVVHALGRRIRFVGEREYNGCDFPDRKTWNQVRRLKRVPLFLRKEEKKEGGSGFKRDGFFRALEDKDDKAERKPAILIKNTKKPLLL